MSHEIRRFARLAGEITDLCQTFVKLRTYTYIHARDVSLASAASSPVLCVEGYWPRGKFIYSRRSVFNPDARFDARLRETSDPPSEFSVLRLIRTIYIHRLRYKSQNVLISSRVLVFNALILGLTSFDRNITRKVLK